MNHITQIVRNVLRVIILISLVILLARPSSRVQALAIVFVSPGGSGVACSQSDPCSLATGLSSVDSGGALFAAGGVYTVVAGAEVVLLTKTIDFWGGWDGEPTGLIIRNSALHESILDGENERRVMTITGTSAVHPFVDGWTIRNGLGSPAPECADLGGNASGCGGGIYVHGAEPKISHSLIHDNAAADSIPAGRGAGGGIYVKDSAGTVIESNYIYYNDAHIDGIGAGGGIYLIGSGGKTTVRYNHFFDNEDSSTISFNHAGHAIYIIGNTDQIQIFNNYIYNNNPLDFAPGDYGSTIYTQYCDDRCLIDENQIYDNHGREAISISYGSPTVQQNTILNPDETAGIMIYSTDTNPHDPAVFALITNNIVAGHASYNIAAAGLSGEEIRAHLIHNTLADAPYGLYISNNNPGLVTFDRGIVSGHSTCGICTSGAVAITVTVSNSLFNSNSTEGLTGSNPLSGDPAFVDPVGGDYHLRFPSAAINRVTTGGIAEDIDDDDRPNGWGATPFDVGADEFLWPYFHFLPDITRP